MQKLSIITPFQLPNHDSKLGHCLKCQKTWKLVQGKEGQGGGTGGVLDLIMFETNFNRHVNFRCNGTEPKKDPGFKCNVCQKVFLQQNKLQNHPCTKMTEKPEDTYVTYRLKAVDCPLATMIKESKDLPLKQRVCFTEKIAIEG